MPSSWKSLWKTGYPPTLILFAAALFYNPDLWLHPLTPRLMSAFTTGSFAILALGLLLFDFHRLTDIFLRMKPLPLAAFLTFFLIAVGHFLFHSQYTLDHLGESLCWILIPLLACVYADAFRVLLPPFLAFLGVWNLTVSLFQWKYNMLIAGITGNINWNASLLLISTPFLVLFLFRIFRRFLPAGIALPPSAAAGVLCLALYWELSSRAAFLALFCSALVLFFFALKTRGRRILTYILLGAALLGTLLLLGPGKNRMEKFLEEEDRPVFYKATLQMILDHPVFGVGGSSFEEAFVPYKTEEYFTRKHAAVRTDHPHNDQLFIAASFGLTGWLAWAILLFLPLWTALSRMRGGKREHQLLIFAFLCLVFHAQLDLIFVSWPLNLIALLILGILWNEGSLTETAQTPQIAKGYRIGGIALGILLLGATAFLVFRTAYVSLAANQIRSGGLSLSEKLRRIDQSLRLAPHGYKALYAMMIDAGKLGSPDLSLKAADSMLRSNIPNYAHIQGYRGSSLLKLGRYDEAFNAYLKEAEHYPLHVIPVYNLAVISKITGRTERIPKIEEELLRRMKMRDITPQMLGSILRNPEFDLKPWDVPVKDGGQGSIYRIPKGIHNTDAEHTGDRKRITGSERSK